jgi:hypothetical protein
MWPCNERKSVAWCGRIVASLGSKEACFIYEFLLCIQFQFQLFLDRIRDFKYTLSTQDSGVSAFSKYSAL